MALYKNLGPICFCDETEHYEIFQTSKNSYVLQIKPHIAISCDLFESFLKKQVDAYSQGIPLSINVRSYKEKGKPFSLILSNCIPFDFSHLQINQIFKIVQAIQRTLTSWSNERLGQINKSLFFMSYDKTIFFSLPLIEKPKDADSSKLLNQVISFVQSICRVNESSHCLLLKRVKSSKNLQNLFEETRYFANIYNLKIQNNVSSKSASNIRNKLSIHSDSAKRSRFKFAIFKQNNSTSITHQDQSSVLKSNTLNSCYASDSNLGQRDSKIKTRDQYDGRCSSKALHLSSTHFSSSIWKERYNNSSHKKSQTISQRSILNAMKHQKSLHKQESMRSVKNSRDLLDSKSSFAVSKVIEESIPKNKKNQNLLKRKSSRHNSKQNQSLFDSKTSLRRASKMDVVTESSKRTTIKEVVNKSLQKWKKNRQEKILIQNQQTTQCLSKNTPKQQKKILKKVSYHPQHKTLFCDAKNQKQVQTVLQKQQQKIKVPAKGKMLSGISQTNIILPINAQQIEHAHPPKAQLTLKNAHNYQTGQTDQAFEKNNQKDKKSRQKLSMQMLQRIPLKQAHQNQFATVNNSSNISLEKSRQKETGLSSKRKTRGPKDIEQRLKQRLEILDFVGEAVRNTQVCYKNTNSECPWQIPAFYLYRQYLIERLQVEQQGYSSISKQNQEITESLQKLYSAVIKKIKKIKKQGIEFASELITCDLTIRDQKQFQQTIKQYIQIVFTALNNQNYSYMLPHAIEIVDAYAILKRQQFDPKKHQQIMNALKNQQLLYLRDRSDIIFANDKQKSNGKK